MLEHVSELKRAAEAAIFASAKPVSLNELFQYLDHDEGKLSLNALQTALSELVEEYKNRGGGFELFYFRGIGYQFRTVSAVSPLMEQIFSQRPRPLSRAAQETLAIIAYRQPATRAEIEFIRGVDAGSIIKNLLEKEVIACVGRKEIVGRPMMFGTTKEFLRLYKLTSLEELPALESFQPSYDRVKYALDKIRDEDEDSDADEAKPKDNEEITI